MFEAIQLQQAPVAAPEKKVEYVFVADASLIHVGGGAATAHF